jgi:hypothetical protein
VRIKPGVRSQESGVRIRQKTRDKDRTEYPISNTEYPMSKLDRQKTEYNLETGT